MINLEKYVDFLVNNDVNSEQFLLLMFIYKNDRELILKYKSKFPTKTGNLIEPELIEDLIQKGLLIKTDTYMLTNKFLNIFLDKYSAVDEIYSIYPSFIEIDGKTIPLKAFSRDSFATIYEEAVLKSVEEHNSVLEDIRYGAENNLIQLSIERFIKSKYYLVLRELRVKNINNKKIRTKLDENF